MIFNKKSRILFPLTSFWCSAKFYVLKEHFSVYWISLLSASHFCIECCVHINRIVPIIWANKLVLLRRVNQQLMVFTNKYLPLLSLCRSISYGSNFTYFNLNYILRPSSECWRKTITTNIVSNVIIINKLLR